MAVNAMLNNTGVFLGKPLAKITSDLKRSGMHAQMIILLGWMQQSLPPSRLTELTGPNAKV